jgi:hypothetical protein
MLKNFNINEILDSYKKLNDKIMFDSLKINKKKRQNFYKINWILFLSKYNNLLFNYKFKNIINNLSKNTSIILKKNIKNKKNKKKLDNKNNEIVKLNNKKNKKELKKYHFYSIKKKKI